MIRLAGQEPYLDPFDTKVTDVHEHTHDARLITSPEYVCKKLLAAGFEKIYDMGPCFRNKEAFGGLHNPEFTMLEWYRAHADYTELMDDIDNLLSALQKSDVACDRFSMRDLFRMYCDIDLNDLLEEESLIGFVTERGYEVSEHDRYEDVFYRVFLREIEPKLGVDRPCMVYDYPSQMAALSRLKKDDERYAERVELYIDGIEIANGFSELIDGEEQRERLLEEQRLRAALGRSVYDIDDDFVDALSAMKPSAGIALGVDRLVMALIGTKKIGDVLAFPAAELFNE